MIRSLRENLKYLGAIVGLIVIAAGVSFYILVNERLQMPWDNRYTVKAEFETAQAVTPGQGQTVTVSGVKVGDVADVQLRNGRAVVSMAIQRDKLKSVGEHATLLLRPKTPLQDMSIEMDPGPPSDPSIGNRILPVSSTEANVNVDEVLAGLDGDTRNYLRLMLSSFGQGLGDNGQNLRQVLAATAPAAAELRRMNATLDGRREDLAELVHHLRGVTGALAGQRAEILKLVQAGNITFGTLDQQQAPLKRSLDLLPGTLVKANRVAGDLIPFTRQLRTTATDLLPVAQRALPTLRHLEPFAREALPAVTALRRLTPAAIPLAGDLRTALRDVRPTVPDVERIGRIARYALNELSFIPGGADKSYLYWLAWFGHDVNSMLSGSDGNGPFWNGVAVLSCTTIDPINGSISLLLNPIYQLSALCPASP
jgi:phospholipid/cholesterol/gamma-HCH transport system substrate-binding protein